MSSICAQGFKSKFAVLKIERLILGIPDLKKWNCAKC